MFTSFPQLPPRESQLLEAKAAALAHEGLVKSLLDRYHIEVRRISHVQELRSR